MGNQSNSKFEWEKNFIVLEKNFNDNTLIVQKRDGGGQFLAREIISTDKKQSQEIKRLIKLKYHNNNLFLTKLVQVYYNNDEGYCSPEDKIYLIFEKPKQTLRQQILSRKFAHEKFSEEEADVILQSGIKAIRSLKQMRHPHNNISSSSLFIDENRRVLLGDPWITPPVYGHDISQNAFTCPSPQKILLQNDQIMSICQYRSDLFSLGTVILEALNFEHMDILYEKGFRKVIQSKIKQKLDDIKNQQLRYKLSIVLSHDPRNRDEIYNLYKIPGLPSQTNQSNLVNKVANKQQKAPKNIINLHNKISPINQLSSQALIPKQKYNLKVPIYQPLNYQNNNHFQYNISSNQVKVGQVNQFNRLTAPHMQGGYKQPHQNVNFQPNTNFSNRPSVNFNNTVYNIPQGYPNSYNYNYNFRNTIPTYQPPNNIPSLPSTYYPQIYTTKQTTINQKIQATDFSKKAQHEVAEVKNNYQPTLIKSTDDFVKTSTNIRYIDSRNSEANSVNEETSSNIMLDKLQHVGNYMIKPINYQMSSNEQHIDPPKQQQLVESGINRRTGSQGSDKVFLQSLNETQNQKKIQIKQQKQTPERRPTRKYNSTIKQQPDEYENSNQRDLQQDVQYVIEQYQAGRYEGQKKNNMRNGFGKFYYNQGSIYEGNWKDNLMNGKGSLYYSNGKLAYEGEWRMDEFHGLGKVYNQDQANLKGLYDYSDFTNVNDYWAMYEGQLNSDRRHGKGKIKLSNGQIFVGSFVADSVEGQGKFYTLNGDIIHGIWKNNKLVRRL